jgi:hypothetical protein
MLIDIGLKQYSLDFEIFQHLTSSLRHPKLPNNQIAA